MEISQNFVAFSEYMNFTKENPACLGPDVNFFLGLTLFPNDYLVILHDINFGNFEMTYSKFNQNLRHVFIT